MKCLVDKKMENECDRNGDNRDGWPNCSMCGETDWDSLFKKRFKTEEVMDLLTQNEGIMDRLCEIEHDHFRLNYNSTVNAKWVRSLISEKVMPLDELEFEMASDEPFEGYLSDRELLVTNLVEQLNTKQRMMLFITAHDINFETQWLLKHYEWQLMTQPFNSRGIVLSAYMDNIQTTQIFLNDMFGDE
tara:strand:+ start:3000 stop:3563 length:564 start_codon:yes stop_codon:yes gene_type:complete